MNIYQMRPLTLSLRNRGICNSEISLGELYCVCVVIHVNLVESRGGAVPLGSCGTTIAFALVLSQAPIHRFRPLLSEPSVRFSRTRLSRWIIRFALGTPYFRLDVSTTEMHIPINILTSTLRIVQPD